MIVVVAAETLLLAVLAVFVVALLRSHAEILRRLERLSPGEVLPRPDARTAGTLEAVDIEGSTPDGGARRIVLSSGPDTLVSFLSSGCTTCVGLLEALEEGDVALPHGLRLVVVTKDRRLERVRMFRGLAGHVDVVMSSAAWDDYSVPGSPYFVHVDGTSGTIVGEGSASRWDQVVSLIVDAGDDRAADVANRARIDDALGAAGIDAGHPSLRPGSAQEANGR